MRQGRLTTSDFQKIYAMQKQTNPTASCCKGQPNIDHIPAIRLGADHEDVARQDYINEMSSSHITFKCVNEGLIVHPLHPHLPDGWVWCDCYPRKGLL